MYFSKFVKIFGLGLNNLKVSKLNIYGYVFFDNYLGTTKMYTLKVINIKV